MSIVDGKNILLVLAIVLGLTAWGLYAERHRRLGKVPGVVWILLTGLLSSNVGLVPMQSPVYDFVGGQLMPMAIPLLLLRANIRNVLRESGMVLPIFLVGSLTVCIGAIVGWYVVDMGPFGAKAAATFAAGFIGGASDFVAVSQITGMTPTEFSVAISAGTPVSILGLLALLTLPSVPYVRRSLGSGKHEPDATPVAGPTSTPVAAVPLNFVHLMLALTLSAAICATSEWISNRLGWQHYNLCIVSVIAILIANLFPKQLARLQGDFELGMLLMYVFFAVIGIGSDATSFVSAAPKLFILGMFIIVIHLVLLFLVAKWFRFDLAETVIGSGANIVGSAAAAGIASTRGWTRLVTPAITTGMLGKAIANFIGIALYRLLG